MKRISLNDKKSLILAFRRIRLSNNIASAASDARADVVRFQLSEPNISIRSSPPADIVAKFDKITERVTK